MRVDHFNRTDYSKRKVDLLLEKARDEKMNHGNYKRAEILLKRIIDTEPNHPEVYYRLAFINAYFEKWEAALFYANETFEYGPSLDEEIKLSALMGYAFTKIGLKQRGKEYFEYAESLDNEKEWTLFIDNYKDLANTRNIMIKKAVQEKEENIEVALQKMRENLCYILSIRSRRNFFITSANQISISPKEAELLAFLIKQ